MVVYGGKGPMINGVLWVEAVIFRVFVGHRLYTRHQILNAVGIDDYLCCIALDQETEYRRPSTSSTYTIFVTIASTYGLDQLAADVGNQSIYFEAVKYEILSQFMGAWSSAWETWFVAIDFAFAVLPWFVVWDLRRNLRTLPAAYQQSVIRHAHNGGSNEDIFEGRGGD
ncbi:hypothetical protein BJX99DRAFT_256899 [Aspergillus californicus]